jgi:hypothetical protein
MLKSFNDWLVKHHWISDRQTRWMHLFLSGMLLMNLFQFWDWRYYAFRSGDYFVYPAFSFLENIPHALNQGIFGLLIVLAILFMANIKTSWASLGIAVIYFYYVFADLLGFHHGIFLAGNLYLLFSVISCKHDKVIRAYGVFAAKLMVCGLYLTAASHKMSADFLQGDVLEQLLHSNRITIQFLEHIPYYGMLFAIGAMLIETAVPLLIWNKYTRPIAFLLGFSLHFGILTMSTRAYDFNLYLPATYVLFIPTQQFKQAITLSQNGVSQQIKALLNKLDRSQQIHWSSDSNGLSLRSLKGLYTLSANIWTLNPIFMGLMVAYAFWLMMVVIDVIGII